MIEFEGVTKRYPDGTVAVEDLSLTVDTGQITVLVGPSGCGKTTALRMINRMIEPSSGRILIDGDDITSRPEAQLRREIGYVIQGAGLFPHRTVLDNVTLAPRKLKKLGADESRALGLAQLDRVGLRHKADARPGTLSEASSSASPSPARSYPVPRSCSPTSRRATSTPPWARRSSNCSATR